MKAAIKYTTPKLVTGKKPAKIAKNSTAEKEIAKNVWYVNYSYNGKQFRIKDNLNRIKDPKQKAYQAAVLLQSIKDDLDKGFDPTNPTAFLELLGTQTISLDDAVKKYLTEITGYLRPKSISSYQSKLRYLAQALPNKQLKETTSKDLENYIHSKIRSNQTAKMFVNNKIIDLDKVVKWTPKTVKSAKGVFRAFFNWCIDKEYIQTNPAIKIDKKKIRSEVQAPERNIPYTKGDMKTLMDYLDTYEEPTAFFARIIYSTCLRPREISELRVKDVDLINQQITVPLSVMKNTKTSKVDLIDIEPTLFQRIALLDYSQYPKEYFLASTDGIKPGEKSIGVNRPYKRLTIALKKLQLDGKGYTLYSFKHYSNIERLNNGWTLAEIMKANRHSSISMTERYLKDISKQTDISKKPVPAI